MVEKGLRFACTYFGKISFRQYDKTVCVVATSIITHSAMCLHERIYIISGGWCVQVQCFSVDIIIPRQNATQSRAEEPRTFWSIVSCVCACAQNERECRGISFHDIYGLN